MNSNHTIQDLVEQTALSVMSPPPRARKASAIPLIRISALALGWVLALSLPALAAAQSYTAMFIQPEDISFFQPRGLNDRGEVTGHYFPDGGTAKPVVWRDSTLSELPLLPGTVAGTATASNNIGQIVGACFDTGGASRACIWQNGSVAALPAIAGAILTDAIDINDAGGVLGHGLVQAGIYPDGTPTYRQDVVVWQGGGVQRIAPPYGGSQMFARAIDASGRVAVSVSDEWTGAWMPARWTPDVPNGRTGAIELLDWNGFAYDINDAGVVCGYDAFLQAVLWTGSSPTVLGRLPGTSWELATSVNGAGTVVGTSFYFSEVDSMDSDYTAFVWTEEDGMRDLNDLLNESSPAFGRVIDPIELNNAGQILAVADGGYALLTPSTLPPPLPAPTRLSSLAGNASVELSWDAVAIASGYNVKRGTVGGGPYTTIAVGVNSTSYVDHTAVNGIRYYYVVSALVDTRESANSNETTARPTAPPLAPSGLAAKGAKAKVTLSWKQSTSPAILRNRVYRSTNGGGYVLVADIPAGVTWTDNQARSKTKYSYVVTAVNSIGLQSPFSSAVSAQPK